MHRAGEEKDDTLKALALSAPQLPLAPLPAIAESVSHKMPDRAFKPNKQAVKDQVIYLFIYFKFLDFLSFELSM